MKKTVIIGASLIVVVGIAIGVFFGTANFRKYNKAVSLYTEGDYAAAAEIFRSLSDYKDSKDLADQADAFYIEEMNKALYQEAMSEFENENYESAIDKFEKLGDYKDSVSMANESKKQLQIKNDNEPPEITSATSEFFLSVDGTRENLRRMMDVLVTIKDNLTNDIEYEIDSDTINYGIPGNYSVTIKCCDEAGNESTADFQVIITHPVYDAYIEAIYLSRDELDGPSVTGNYSYNGLTILNDDIEWMFTWGRDADYLPQDSLYHSVAKGLEGYDLFTKDGTETGLYGIWGADLVPLAFGFPKPSLYEDIKSYVRNAQEFVVNDDDQQLYVIMKKLQSLSCAVGHFDFENSIYNFEITDLSSAAKEMMISETMLGYTIAVLDCYKSNIAFDGNTTSIIVDFTA